MQLTAYVNGHFLPIEEATVHIEDRGFQFADGVYEVVTCLGGLYLDLDAHIDRLQRSCEAIAIPMPLSTDALGELVREMYRRNDIADVVIYIQITRGVSPRSHTVPTGLTPTLVITVRPLPQANHDAVMHGISAITMRDIRWLRCDIKSIAMLGTVLGKLEAQQRGASEGFWLDDEGHVLEGCASNIFSYIDGKLVTHPLDHRVLGGITRDMLLHQAGLHGLTVVERPWRLDEAELSECMISSTTSGLLPVCRIDDHAVGDGKPGPVSLQLQGWLAEAFTGLRGREAR